VSIDLGKAALSRSGLTFGEERHYCRSQLRRGKRALVTARHAYETGIAQQCGQLVGVRALILVADRDECRDGDLTQGMFGSRDERVQHE
jgi:hypothetical protein